MKKIIYSSFTVLLLGACSGENVQEKEKKTDTVIEHKIDAVKEAKAIVTTVNETVKKVEKIAVEAIIQKELPSASSLYLSSCASCHGGSAEKSALNNSAAIATWSSKKIQDALHGYKNGTYGGTMKGIMQGQSKPLSNEDIKRLSDYISSL